MKKLWALDIPGLPLRAFQPRLGGMTLHAGVESDFSGWSGGYGSGSDGSDSSSSGAVEGDLGFAVFSAIDKVESGQPLNSVDVAALQSAGLGEMAQEALDRQAEIAYQEQVQRDLAAAQKAEQDRIAEENRKAEIAYQERAQKDLVVAQALSKIESGDRLSIGDLQALSDSGRGGMLLNGGRSVNQELYQAKTIDYENRLGEAFSQASNRGLTFESALSYAQRVVGPAPTPPDLTQPSGGGVATVDTGVEEPLGPPPPGFTGPPDDRTGPPPEGFTGPPEYLSEEAANTPARETGWQVDDQGRAYYVDDRGVRMSPAGVALDPEEERWGSTPAREPGTLPINLPQQGSSMQDLANKERQEYFEEGANRPIGGTPGWDPFGTGEILSGGTAFSPPMEGLGMLPQELEEVRLGSGRGQQGLSMQDIAEKELQEYFEEGANRPIGGTPGWELDPFAREGDPGFMGPVQPSGGALPSGAAGTALGGLPGALPGTVDPLESQIIDILDKVRDTYAYRDEPRSTTGLSRSDLQALVDAGLGKYDLSEGQTIDQALASLKTGEFLDQNMPSIIGMLAGPVPQIMVESIFAMKEGYKPSSIVGTIVSSIIGSAIQMATGVRVPGQAVQDLAQGNVGKAAFGVGVVNVAARLGLPVGTVNAALNGNLGAAAANQMLSEVVMESAKQMGADPGLIATVAMRSGLGQAAFDKIAGAINDNSIVRSINDFVGEISSGIKGFGIDTGLGEAVTSREGALAAGDTSGGYSGSYGGSEYESEQAGLIADAIQAGQPKKKIPRWSDMFFSNLARDMSTSFAGPPPIDRGELDDLEESLNIADAYNDPSRRQDVLDPLGNLEAGGDRLSVDLGGGDVGTIGGAQDKTDLANIIREYAQLNDPSFVIYDDGTLGIRDYDLNVIHRFDSAGNVLGTYPAAYSGNESTSDVAKELLNTSYVSSLFGDRNEQITRRLAGTEEQDRMTEDEYRALFGSGESANPPTTGTGQAVFGDISGTFGSRADALAAFPGLSLVSKDTGTGDETYENQGFTIIAKADGSVTATPKDQPTMIVELVAPTTVAPPPPAPSPAPPPPVVTPEDLVTSPPPPAPEPPPPAPAPPAPAPADALAPPSTQDPTAPGKVTDQTQQQPTSQQPPVTQEPSTQPTTSLTTQDVQKIVQDALTANPSLTEQQVQQIVSQALQGLPAGLTSADVSAAISSAISGLPQAPTAQDIDAAISRAMTNVATQEDVRSAIAGIQFPAGITEADVTKAITDYMTANPGLSAQDVAGQVADQLSKLPTYATPGDVTSAINSALTDVATKTDVANAIAGIQFPAGITTQDVTKVISDYMQANPGLSAADVATQVSEQLAKLPQFATPADVQTAINSALTSVATKTDVANAIAGIQFPVGISSADVTKAITDYMAANPGLSSQDVAQQVADQLKTLPAYATPADVEAAIGSALTNVATKGDVAAAIAGIQFPAGITPEDVTNAITSYMQANPGLSAADVADQVSDELSKLPTYATPGDVTSAINDALTNVATKADVANAIAGIQFPQGITPEDVTSAITDYMKANPGLSSQDVANQVAEQLAKLPAFATPENVQQTVQGALDAYAANAGAALDLVKGQLGDAIQAAREAGAQGDQALQEGLNALASDLGTTKEALLSQLGTTEEGLRAEFSSQFGGLQTQVTGLEQSLFKAIADARSAGAEGDQALQAGLDALAGNLGTTRTDLLASLGATEQSLRAEFSGLLGGVSGQVEAVNEGLKAAIADAISSGLAGDAALQAGLDALAGDLGTTKESVLAQLGTTEQALRQDFAAQLSGVQTELAGFGSSLSQAIADARAAGLQGDAALQAGLDALSDRLGTTKDDLLAELGTTEQALRTQFETALGGVQSALSEQLGGLRQETQGQYEALTAAQQAEVANRVQQGQDLARAISDVQSGLSQQLGGLQQGMQAQYEALTAAQQAEVQNRINQGQGLEAAINAVATGVGQRLTDVESGLTQQIGGVEDRLNARVDELMAQGLDYQTATNQALQELGGSIGDVRSELTSQIAGLSSEMLEQYAGLTSRQQAEVDARVLQGQDLTKAIQDVQSGLQSQIVDVQTQVNELGAGLQSAIAEARAAGLEGDAALQVGLDSLANTLGTTKQDLLDTLGTTEQALRADFASQLGGVQTEVSQLSSSLSQAIADARAAGLQGDQALQAGVDAVAASLGTTRQDLLDQLGTTEQGLRTEFATQIGGVQTQVEQLNQSLQTAIADAREAGLQGDAALQVGLETLASNLGTTKSELLSQLGTTEQALRSDLASQLGEVQSQVTQLGSDLAGAIEAARAAGLEGDAALQAGLDALAGNLGTTKADLLDRLGQTEQSLRDQFEQAIGGVSTNLQDVEYRLQSRIDELVAAGNTQQQATQQALAELSNQFGEGISQAVVTLREEQTAGLTNIQQNIDVRINQLMQQGMDYQSATNAALQELSGGLGALAGQQVAQGEATQEAIAGVEGRLNDRINELMQQGAGYQEATDQALRELSGTIGDVRSELSSGLSDVRSDLSQQYDALTAAQKAEVDARIQQGQDLSKAIGDVRSGLTEQIAGVQQGVTTQVGDLDTRLNARIDELVTQGSTFQDATTQALGELRGGLTGLSEAQQAAEEAEKERARLQLQQQAQGQMLSTASGFQSRPSGAVEQYKASFLDPFIVGGEAPEFKSPLAGFTQSAITGGFLPSAPSQKRMDATPEDSEYFRAAEIAGIAPPLQIYDPTQEYKGLFGFRQGGLVPLMAKGGTRYGENAHGALRVLEHSGKHRVDYRQGDAVTGIGDGQSDDIPAMLADGEFVIPADVVAALGNGSTKAGSDKLYDMMHNIRRHHRSAGPKDLPPPAKSPLEYIKPRRRAK